MAHAAQREKAWSSHLRSALNVKGRQCRIEDNVQYAYVTRLLFLGVSNNID